VRSNSKDIEIITFDELLARIESLQKLIQRKVKPKRTKNKHYTQQCIRKYRAFMLNQKVCTYLQSRQI